MFTGKLAQLAIAAVFAASYLTSSAASAAFTPHVAPSVQSNAESYGRGAKPDYPPCLGYGSQAYWVETSTSPEQWSLEQSGRYCPTIILYTCTGSEFTCELEYDVKHEAPAKQYPFASQAFKHIVLIPIGPNGTGVITPAGGKVKLIGVLSLGALSGSGSATAVAFNAKTQTTYVSVSNTAGSGPVVLVYQGGGTTPSSSLTDPAASPIAGGVAVDSKGDVFWAFNDDSGVGHIDEFIGGKGEPRRIDAPGFSSAAGDLQVDNKDNLVASWPEASLITIFSTKKEPRLLGSFTTTGAPNSISLDAKNANIYVADTTNNLIDQYSYPSGTLVASNAPPQLDGQTPVLQAVLAPDP